MEELKQLQKSLLDKLYDEGIESAGNIIFTVAESGYRYDEKKYNELLQFSIARADNARESRFIADIGLLINSMNF